MNNTLNNWALKFLSLNIKSDYSNLIQVLKVTAAETNNVSCVIL